MFFSQFRPHLQQHLTHLKLISFRDVVLTAFWVLIRHSDSRLWSWVGIMDAYDLFTVSGWDSKFPADVVTQGNHSRAPDHSSFSGLPGQPFFSFSFLGPTCVAPCTKCTCCLVVLPPRFNFPSLFWGRNVSPRARSAHLFANVWR